MRFSRSLRQPDVVYVWHYSFTCVMTHSHVWTHQSLFAIFSCHWRHHSRVWRDWYSCVTWLIHVCDMIWSHVFVMTHSHAWYDSFTCAWHILCSYVTWLIHNCDMIHSRVWNDPFTCVWHDSFTCVWHDRISCVWHDSFTCVTWLLHICVAWLILMCDMPPSHVCHDLFARAWRHSFTRVRHGSFACVWHDPFTHVWRDWFTCVRHLHVCEWLVICVTWVIYMCDMTHTMCQHTKAPLHFPVIVGALEFIAGNSFGLLQFVGRLRSSIHICMYTDMYMYIYMYIYIYIYICHFFVCVVCVCVCVKFVAGNGVWAASVCWPTAFWVFTYVYI